MILPPHLQPGDTVGFFSPSSPATAFAPRRTARAIAFLESKGLKVRPGRLTGASDGYRSGSIEARADELNALLRDPSVRAVMSTIGGSNSNSLLPYVDYDALARDPKVVVGYSDVTALLMAIHARTGLVTFYGPALVASLGEWPPLVDATWSAFADLLLGAPGVPHRLHVPVDWSDEHLDWEHQARAKTMQPNAIGWHGTGRVRGRLIGGNLNTLTAIWGSDYMPAIRDGDVLLVEDSLKSIDTVERLFAFLKLGGVFDRIGALLLGKHERFDDRGTGRTPCDVLREVLAGQPLPVVDGFDSAHTHPMVAVPLGTEVEVDFDAGSVTLTGPWCAPR